MPDWRYPLTKNGRLALLAEQTRQSSDINSLPEATLRLMATLESELQFGVQTYELMSEISGGRYNCYERLVRASTKDEYTRIWAFLIELDYCLSLIDRPPPIKHIGPHCPAAPPSPAVAALLRVATKASGSGRSFVNSVSQVGLELGIEPALLGQVALTLYQQRTTSFAQATALLSYARQAQELVDHLLGKQRRRVSVELGPVSL